MRRLNLFLDLMSIVHNMVEEGVSNYSVNEALEQLDSVFDDFEENDGIEENNMHKMFEDTFFKIEHMPEELKQYCHTIDTLHRESDIYLEALPTHFRRLEQVQAQLITGIFGILNKLLGIGITSCHNHQARMDLYEIFNTFTRQEDLKTAQHLKTLLEKEQEGIKAESRLRKALDDIATKEASIPQELKEYFQTIESLRIEDMIDEDLQVILAACEKSKPIDDDCFYGDFYEMWNWALWHTFNDDSEDDR